MKGLIRYLVIFFSIVLLLPPVVSAQNNGWEESFFKANQAYKDGQFQEAIEGYEALIVSGHISGDVFFNLGNAYFRIERPGLAILNYERARMLIPRDADLNFNLRMTRDQILDAVEEPQSFMGAAFFWIKSLNLSELFLGLAVLNILFWGILLIRLFKKAEWNYYFSIILLVFWIIAGLSFGLKYYQAETDTRTVILPGEINVLAGPDVQDTILFKLHEGTIVLNERSEDGWALIRLPDEKRGWVESDKIGHIRMI